MSRTSALTSEQLYDVALETEGIELYESWELKNCWAYWILPNGKILGADKTIGGHDGMVSRISLSLPSFDQAHGYHYLNYHLNWIRTRTPCPNRKLETAIFDCVAPVTMNQKKTMRDYMDFNDVDCILRIQGNGKGPDVYLRGVPASMYLGD